MLLIRPRRLELAVHTIGPDVQIDERVVVPVVQVVDGRAGLGFSFLSPRPLPYGNFAAPVSLLDASAAVAWGPLELSFDLFNALNAQYAAVEYAFPSDWSPNDGFRSRVPQRHTAAGSPLTWMLSLGVQL